MARNSKALLLSLTVLAFSAGFARSEESNPFRFGQESFLEQRWEHGRVSVLQNFLNKSDLFQRIANYRIATVELEGHAFFAPLHLDADAVVFVARGRGSITLIRRDTRETHDLQQGDIYVVPAGAIVYSVNKNINEKLVMIQLISPLSTNGQFEIFFEAGGSSDLARLSDEILEASFNTSREELDELFNQQKQAPILRASEEEVRELSRQSSGARRTFNLLEMRPSYSSRRGQLFVADGEEFKPLKSLDVQVSFLNLTQGSMVAPLTNTRATKLAVVVGGAGYIEMACPQFSCGGNSQRREQGGEQEQEQGRGQGEQEQGRGLRHHNVRSQATTGTVIVTPPGLPTATVAVGERSFEVVYFEINSEGSTNNILAGRNNIFNRMHNDAKKLAFGMPARKVNEIFQEQKEELFLAGPKE